MQCETKFEYLITEWKEHMARSAGEMKSKLRSGASISIEWIGGEKETARSLDRWYISQAAEQVFHSIIYVNELAGFSTDLHTFSHA